MVLNATKGFSFVGKMQKNVKKSKKYLHNPKNCCNFAASFEFTIANNVKFVIVLTNYLR